MLFRQYYFWIDTNCPTPIHHAYYFQTRFSTPDKKAFPNQKRREPVSYSMIDPDLNSLLSNVTVIQPARSTVMFIALNRHSSFRGSVNVSDNNLQSKIFEQMYINDVTLSPKRSGASQESGSHNIYVTYPTSRTFSRLGYYLSGCREQFQQDLTHHLLWNGYVDAKHISGEVVIGNHSINNHVNVSYCRIQKHTNPHTWYIGEHKIPTLSVDGFKQIPATVQQQLGEVFDCAQKYTECKYPKTIG
jgi:hypothetical protein